MSAILGVFGSRDRFADEHVQAMLGGMSARGTERVEVWREAGVVLAVGRYEWELDGPFSGPVLIAQDDRFVVAADAAVYYRTELKRALAARGVAPAGDTPAELILAAMHVWGDDFVHALEGDLAVIVWDRARKQALCVREFSGKRPLHYARIGSEFVVASTIGGVAAHPGCSAELNLPLLAANATGLVFSAGPETCYKAVQVLPNAHRMRWTDGRVVGPERYWEAPVDGPSSHLGHDEAAEHLLELLTAATRERVDPASINTVWMSGGWDSSAVFGAAQNAAQRSDSAITTVPVSISYPHGDPGREDEWIQAIADRWQVPVHWIDIADIPFLDREPERAAARDEPYAHLYDKWNTALAEGTRACGSRIALDGNGGDQLFQNSDVFLADLFRRGQWIALAREWPARRRGGFRSFFSTVLQPNLPSPVLRFAGALRGGRPLKPYLQRPLAEWIQPNFAARHALLERDADFLLRPIRASHVGREIDWLFTCLYVSRAFSLLGSFALAHGVELRSPLSDRRVVEFALARPWWERSSGKETKLLLRRAMRGLLPDEVLAPRPRRTGITGGYSHRWMRDRFPALLEQTLAQPLVLAELGVVDSDSLRRAAHTYATRGGTAFTRVNLLYTLQTELWLRGRSDVRRPAPTHEAGASRLLAVRN